MGDTIEIVQAPAASIEIVQGAATLVEISGPAGPQGERGEQGPSLVSYSLEVYAGTTANAPETISLVNEVPASGDLLAFVSILFGADGGGYALVSLPELTGTHSVGTVVVRALLFEDGTSPANVKVVVANQEQTAIYPSTGYDELALNSDHVFRWNGYRWDLDVMAGEASTASFQVFKPNYSGTLAAYRGFKPTAANSPGTPGMLAWGYADGAERLYICVANNLWRRLPITSW